MTLTLVMIRCPDNVTPERREVHGGEFTIGRAQGNEWVVPDSERLLSKRHCRLVYDVGVGDWELHDLSTNGTFLNQDLEPIGKGACRVIRNGDRIKLGLYELDVVIDEHDRADVVPGHRGERASHPYGDAALREPMESRPERPFGHDGIRWPDSGSVLDAPNTPILPPDFDPLAPGSEPFSGPTDPDHVPALQSAFHPPPVAVIPDNWDADPPESSQPQPQVPRSLQPSMMQEDAHAPAKQERVPLTAAAGEERLIAAFLRGLGLNETALSEPEKTLEHVGAAVRATVSGLREVLIARASIKDEFRIAQTLIRAKGNNPLKFSLNDDDALATLMGRRGGMAPEDAIAEAFVDLRMHELATVSAMQEATRVLLAQFEPESIERKIKANALNIHPAQRKARAWEIFVEQHRSVTQALADDFDSVFGKAFARAYEQAIDKLTNDEETS
ncbi:MAG: type VI secretion system-associated FHA domain protein TagH [Proteobacteria bacterium]|nr:type VI secretion system-associated FHA domain protein TagH [Pseudomonadota bacterium]